MQKNLRIVFSGLALLSALALVWIVFEEVFSIPINQNIKNVIALLLAFSVLMKPSPKIQPSVEYY